MPPGHRSDLGKKRLSRLGLWLWPVSHLYRRCFPKLVQVETTAVKESQVIDDKAETILRQLRPITLTADNGYAKVMRIRRWAQQGVILLSNVP